MHLTLSATHEDSEIPQRIVLSRDFRRVLSYQREGEYARRDVIIISNIIRFFRHVYV